MEWYGKGKVKEDRELLREGNELLSAYQGHHKPDIFDYFNDPSKWEEGKLDHRPRYSREIFNSEGEPIGHAVKFIVPGEQ